MKVKELIFYLNVLDPEKEVYIPSNDEDCEYYKVLNVKEKELTNWENESELIEVITLEFT